MSLFQMQGDYNMNNNNEYMRSSDQYNVGKAHYVLVIVFLNAGKLLRSVIALQIGRDESL